jgi:hypothetical protein
MSLFPPTSHPLCLATRTFRSALLPFSSFLLLSDVALSTQHRSGSSLLTHSTFFHIIRCFPVVRTHSQGIKCRDPRSLTLRNRLHLTWRATVRRTQRKRWGTERTFPTMAAINNFCDGLMPVTHVATCILRGRWMDSFLYQKAHVCFNRASRPSLHPHCPVTLPTNHNITYHMCNYMFPTRCYCLIQSAPKLVPWYSQYATPDSNECS